MRRGSIIKKSLAAFILLAAGAAVLGGWLMFSDLLMDKYATFDSPDGRFQIVVMRNKQFFSTGPGQSGDAPGEVRLYNREGDLLEKADVEMVQMVENVEWKADSVYIKFVADWKLPNDK
jgi:hypothetical protein